MQPHVAHGLGEVHRGGGAYAQRSVFGAEVAEHFEVERLPLNVAELGEVIVVVAELVARVRVEVIRL